MPNPEDQYAGVGEAVLCARSQALGKILPRPYGARGGRWATVPGRRPCGARTCPWAIVDPPLRGGTARMRRSGHEGWERRLCGRWGVATSRFPAGMMDKKKQRRQRLIRPGDSVRLRSLPPKRSLDGAPGRSLAEICGFPPCRRRKGDRMGHGAGLVEPAMEKRGSSLRLRMTNSVWVKRAKADSSPSASLKVRMTKIWWRWLAFGGGFRRRGGGRRF
jgi:hypothetical protein